MLDNTNINIVMVEIIIVLGNRNPDIMRKRVDRALDYFNSSPIETELFDNNIKIISKYLLFSGGSSDGVSKPEGAVMMDDYCKTKVASRFCLVEKTSRTTVENLVNSKNLIQNNFTNAFQKPLITICTSSFHIYRSTILAKLIFNEYDLKFIHTGEDIPWSLFNHEEKLLNRTLKKYVKQQTDPLQFVDS